jgi:hypothetical protein
MRSVLLVILLATGARAAQDPLDALRGFLMAARQHPSDNVETRGATAELTLEKHNLRDWIEMRLSTLGQEKDTEKVLAYQLNSELEREGLKCTGTATCEQSIIGYVGDIQLQLTGKFLILQTAVGIQCGFDESAYVYRWRNNGWQRFWENEQNLYTKGKYLPQHFWSVAVSETKRNGGEAANEYLIATLAQSPWCSSNWQAIYYRIWRATENGVSETLVDGTDYGYLAEPPAMAVWPGDVLMEYAIASVDGAVHNRRLIRHYVFEDDKLKRTEPYVLSPRDYVEERLGDAQSLAPWRNKTLEFIQPTRHCRPDKDLWQIGVADAHNDETLGYVLVRWLPPYRFSLAGVSKKAFPGCTEDDPGADEFRTLFVGNDHH